MKHFCVIGNPIEHSLSPRLHNLAYKLLHVEAKYSKLLIKNDKDIKDIFLKCKFDGMNITIPHKETVFSLCDEVHGIAKKIGTVNTIIRKDNNLIGHNTDAPGFIKSIEGFKDIQKVLILGAGGTAKALSFALQEKNIDVNILNRSQNRLDFLKNSGFSTYCYTDSIPNNYDLLINTTSAGLTDDMLPAPKEMLLQASKNSRYAYDVIYNKKTPFLKLLEENGLTCKNGIDMLLYQAVFAFKIFFENKFKEDEIANAMRLALAL